MADAVGHEAGDRAPFLQGWVHWVESHLWFTVALFVAANFARHYLETCRGLIAKDLRVVLLRCVAAVFFGGLFLLADTHMRNRSGWFRLGCFVAAEVLFFVSYTAVHAGLAAACPP